MIKHLILISNILLLFIFSVSALAAPPLHFSCLVEGKVISGTFEKAEVNKKMNRPARPDRYEIRYVITSAVPAREPVPCALTEGEESNTFISASHIEDKGMLQPGSIIKGRAEGIADHNWSTGKYERVYSLVPE